VRRFFVLLRDDRLDIATLTIAASVGGLTVAPPHWMLIMDAIIIVAGFMAWNDGRRS